MLLSRGFLPAFPVILRLLPVGCRTHLVNSQLVNTLTQSVITNNRSRKLARLLALLPSQLTCFFQCGKFFFLFLLLKHSGVKPLPNKCYYGNVSQKLICICTACLEESLLKVEKEMNLSFKTTSWKRQKRR